MDTRTRNILKGAGAILSLAIVLNFYWILWSAFSTPSKSVSIYFNSFGEGVFEMFMYLTLLPFLIIPSLMTIGEAMKEKPITIPALERRRRIALVIQILVTIPSVYLFHAIGLAVAIISCIIVIYYNLVLIPSRIRQLSEQKVVA